MRTIETDRLILRPFTREDIEPAYQLNLDAEVSKYTGDGGVVSREEIERRIVTHVLGDYARHGYGRHAVELKSTGEHIGFAGLKFLDDLNEVDLGYRLARTHWGKGLATEAGRVLVDFGMQDLELPSIIALLLPDNIGSVRVLEKLGFTFEGEQMEDDLLAHCYRLTREQWASNRSE